MSESTQNTTNDSLICSKAKDVLFAWAKANNEGDITAAGNLYAETAILLPTFSRKSAHDESGIKDYFVRLSQNKNLSVQIHEKTIKVRPLGGDHFVVTGLYCFCFDIDDEPMRFEARFTMIVNPTLPRPILHHHSSAIPRGY